MRAEATRAMIKELKQFGSAHLRNGERRTADLLFRAADYIAALEDDAKRDRKRLDRLVAMRMEEIGA